MSLLNSVSAANRVISQGNTYIFTLEPAMEAEVTLVNPEEGTVVDAALVSQWRVTAHLAKRYCYVGLFKDAAEGLAGEVEEAYVVNVQRYARGLLIDQETGRGVYKYLPVVGQNFPTCFAAVTPTHGDGPLWDIEVDVDATIEAYYDSPPTLPTIKGLFTSIANFPEIVSPSTSITYPRIGA